MINVRRARNGVAGVVLALARFLSAALLDFVPRAVEINVYKMYEKNMRTNETYA